MEHSELLEQLASLRCQFTLSTELSTETTLECIKEIGNMELKIVADFRKVKQDAKKSY